MASVIINPFTGDLIPSTPGPAGPSGATGSISSAPAGSAAAPSIAFTGDLDTGIYSPDANQVAISTGGSRRLNIDSTGALTLDTGDATIYGVRVGRGAGASATNTAVGNGALQANTTGVENVAIGYQTLYSNTTGNDNTANGYGALFTATTSDNNTATGYFALRATTGANNTATGSYALRANNTGGGNTANGMQALYFNTIGGSNTAAGYLALYSNTTGSSNCCLGYASGSDLTTGSNNTIIGSIPGTAGLANTVIIGAGSTERLRIDSFGKLLVGTSTANDLAGLAANVQSEGNANAGGLIAWANVNTSQGSYLALGKSRGTVSGSNTIIQNGDQLGTIYFFGADGVDRDSWGASIAAEVDNTPGANDMPGRLVFSTTADGAASPTERMRIDNAGRVLVGTATANTSGAKLQTSDGLTFPATQVASSDPNTLDDYEEGTFTPAISTGAGGPVVLSTAVGQYTKIGNVVTFRLRVIVSNANSAGDFTKITGLPFVPSSAIATRTAVACGSIDNVTGSTPDNIGATYIANGITEIRLFTSTGGTIVLTNSSAMDFNGTYFV